MLECVSLVCGCFFFRVVFLKRGSGDSRLCRHPQTLSPLFHIIVTNKDVHLNSSASNQNAREASSRSRIFLFSLVYVFIHLFIKNDVRRAAGRGYF